MKDRSLRFIDEPVERETQARHLVRLRIDPLPFIVRIRHDIKIVMIAVRLEPATGHDSCKAKTTTNVCVVGGGSIELVVGGSNE